MTYLIKDKYFPKKFEEFLFHEKRLRFYKNVSYNNDIPNIIIYGPNGSGKYTIATNILNSLYGQNVKKNLVKFNILKTPGNYKEVEIFKSNYHYEINVNKYLFNDNSTLCNLLNSLINTFNVKTLSYNIIIVRNIEFLQKEIINYFKCISEKHSSTVRLILITSNFSSISSDLLGRFSSLRVPSPSNNEIKKYIKFVSNKEKIKISEKNIDLITKNCERNLNKLTLILQFSITKNTFVPYKDPLKYKIKEIIGLCNSKNVSNILVIRSKVYDLITQNHSINDIFKYLVKYIFKLKVDINIKQNLLQHAAIYQHRTKKSYKEIIHIEAFIMLIMKELSSIK